MSADRVDIGDAIIAGMSHGDDDLERLACIVKSLDEAGYVIVPKEPTREMLLAPGRPYGGKVDEKIGLLARAASWRKMIEARP